MGPLVDALGRIGARHAAVIVVDDIGVFDHAGDLDAQFALASVSKMLAAYGFLIAHEEGILDLDRPAGPPGATVRHCLAHASGLGYERTDPLVGPPGARRAYSNAGIEVVADLVAEEAGMDFSDYLDEGVFAPLGMTHSTLEGSPAHGARSSAGDLGRFSSELLRPTLVSDGTLGIASTVAFAGLDGIVPGYGRQQPCDWGLGFEIRGMKDPHWTGKMNSPSTFGHFGRSGTFCSVDPLERVAIALLTDREFDAVAKREWPRLADGVIVDHRSAPERPDNLRAMRARGSKS
ncbi:MAG TPA: serine hydrolase domain-containing protein [Acidimicrobiales bacterium]|nr:serine hydrolase domain-containing protein [Acidimicrobiales bacterium]